MSETIADRVAYVSAIMQAFATHVDSTRTHLNLTDLLTDLMHWAAGEGIDFEVWFEQARANYLDETGELSRTKEQPDNEGTRQ